MTNLKLAAGYTAYAIEEAITAIELGGLEDFDDRVPLIQSKLIEAIDLMAEVQNKVAVHEEEKQNADESEQEV